MLCLLPIFVALPAQAQDAWGMTISPSQVSVRRGAASQTITVTIPLFTGAYMTGTGSSLNAYAHYSGSKAALWPTQLSFDGLPRGVTPDPNPVAFDVPGYPATSASVTFRLRASTTATEGTYPDVTVSVNQLQAYGTMTVVVLPPQVGSFSAKLEKAALSACPGGPAVQNKGTITPLEGYSGSPSVTFPLLPADVTVTPSSIRVPALPPARDVPFDVRVAAGAQPGQRLVVVHVTDSNGVFAGTSFVVNIEPPDFGATISPLAVTLEAGGAGGSVTASLSPGACQPPATVTVYPSQLPDGVVATPAFGVLEAPSYTPVVFTLSASGSAPDGTASAAFLFTPSTGETKTVPLAITVVRTGRIGVDVERKSIALCPGGGAQTNTLTVSSVDGYAGTPTVTFPGLPDGLTVSPSTIPVPSLPPSRIVTFTVSASPGAAPGPRVVTALVSDPRGISTPATFSVNVGPTDFAPSAVPSAVLLNAGGAPATIEASLVPGDCPPTADIAVMPSGLPPGITVAPSFAILSPPAFAPAAFSFQASSSAAPGPSTITFTYSLAAGGDTSRTATAVVTVCGEPGAPASPFIRPQGSPEGPVTATDFLDLGWGVPESEFLLRRYEWRINAGAWTATAGTSASAPPRGSVDPIQLFVRGYACDPEKGPGPEGVSPVYSLAPPVASFSVPASIVAGQPATFTDTSSPQATSWLWFPGDGMPATTVQSPTVTFSSAGPRTVVLVATNGSGSSSKSTTINVLPASSVRASSSFSFQSLGRERDGRLALDRVQVEPGATLLLRRIEGEGEAVAFLRLVDAEGKAVVERRLVLAAGEEARHDLAAWGSTGAFRVEVVGPEGLEAAVEKRSVPLGGPGLPVTPRPSGSQGTR
jgi:PKD repeat protein